MWSWSGHYDYVNWYNNYIYFTGHLEKPRRQLPQDLIKAKIYSYNIQGFCPSSWYPVWQAGVAEDLWWLSSFPGIWSDLSSTWISEAWQRICGQLTQDFVTQQLTWVSSTQINWSVFPRIVSLCGMCVLCVKCVRCVLWRVECLPMWCCTHLHSSGRLIHCNHCLMLCATI